MIPVFVSQNEVYIRLISFFSILILVSFFEYMSPCRKLNYSKMKRWLSNIGIVVVNNIVIKLFFTLSLVEVSGIIQKKSWGLLNYMDVHWAVNVLFIIIAFDLIIYFQHILFHKISILWKFHQVHHADLDYDLTTGIRFHPVEIIISMIIKLIFVLALGASPVAVILFEVILNGSAMFNHGNIILPNAIDSVLRIIIVTPDMHRIHHSPIVRETNSNYGFFLSIWDRVFNTYRIKSINNQEVMKIGLEYFRDAKYLSLNWLIAMPFLERYKK